MKLLALVVCLVLAGCATFTERDATYLGEGAWQAGHLVDVLQTVKGAAEGGPCFEEGDPITRRLIGRKPSEAGVIAWGAGLGAFHAGVTQALRDTDHPHLAAAWEVLTLGLVGDTIAHNVSVGVRLGAPNTVTCRAFNRDPVRR